MRNEIYDTELGKVRATLLKNYYKTSQYLAESRQRMRIYGTLKYHLKARNAIWPH